MLVAASTSTRRQEAPFRSAASELKGRGRAGSRPMRRSSVHGSSTPPDEPRDRRSASAEVARNRRASESHLRRMMDAIHLDELVEQTPIAVAVLSTDDRVLLISKQFTRMFGYQPNEVLGRSINDLIVPEPLVASARDYPGKLEHGTTSSKSKRSAGARMGPMFMCCFLRVQSLRPPASTLRTTQYIAISPSESTLKHDYWRVKPGSGRWPIQRQS